MELESGVSKLESEQFSFSRMKQREYAIGRLVEESGLTHVHRLREKRVELSARFLPELVETSGERPAVHGGESRVRIWKVPVGHS